MKIETIKKALFSEYKLKVILFSLGQDVTFTGTELECYKMAYKFRNKESYVSYSENLKTWAVSFPQWFTIEFAERME